MKSRRPRAVVIVVVSLAVSVLAVLGGRAVSAQDTGQAKYSVRVPNGLACHTIAKTRDYVFTEYGKR